MIDCVATDHAPHSAEEKEVPFEEAAMGVTGLETAFASCTPTWSCPACSSCDLLVDRMTPGGARSASAAQPRAGKRGEPRAVRSRGRVEAGEEG